MKKTILHLASVLILPISGYAQPTLSRADLAPVIGDHYSIASTTNYQVQTISGPNQVWDFSTLQADKHSEITYMDAASGINAGSFPGATIVAISPNGHEDYDSIGVMGSYRAGGYQVSGNVLYTLSPKQLSLPYPLVYGATRIPQPVVGTGTTQVGPVTMAGTDTLETVGWGTLKLPGGNTYSNVIAVKQILNQTHTFQPYTNTTTGYRYMFYAPGIHMPVLELSKVHTEASIGFTNDNTDALWYDRTAMGIATPGSAAAGFRVYPVPARGSFNVELTTSSVSICRLYLIDVLGHIVKETGIRGTRNSIDCRELPAGVYRLQLVTAEGTFAQPLLLE